MNISHESMNHAIEVFKAALARGMSIDCVEDAIGGAAFVFFASKSRSRAYIECHNDGQVICVFDDRGGMVRAHTTSAIAAVESVERFLAEEDSKEWNADF